MGLDLKDLPFKKPKLGEKVLAVLMGGMGICIIAFLIGSLYADWMQIGGLQDVYFSLTELCIESNDGVKTCYKEDEVCGSLSQDYCNIFKAGKSASGLLVSSIVFTVVAVIAAIFEIFLTKLVVIPVTVFCVFEGLSFILTIAGMSVECSALDDLWVKYFDSEWYVRYPYDPGTYLSITALLFEFFGLVIYVTCNCVRLHKARGAQKKSDQPAVSGEQPPEDMEQPPPDGAFHGTFAVGAESELPPPNSTVYQEQPVSAVGARPEQPPPGGEFCPVPAVVTAPKQPPPDGMDNQQPPEAAVGAAPEQPLPQEQPPPAVMIPQEPPEQQPPAEMLSGEKERAEIAGEKRAEVVPTKNVAPSSVVRHCTECGAALAAEAKFCSECGTKVEAKKCCPQCGSPANGKFCAECGTPL